MAQIFKFQNFKEIKEKVKKFQEQEIDEKIISDEILCLNFKGLQKVIETNIFKTLFEKEIISSKHYLCGVYIAKTISETVKSPPQSWYIVDYLPQAEKDYYSWQKVADLCFLISSFFIGRSNHRRMKYKDYLQMGKSFYYIFYSKSDMEIAYLMGNNFKEMAQVTRETLSNITINPFS